MNDAYTILEPENDGQDYYIIPKGFSGRCFKMASKDDAEYIVNIMNKYYEELAND